MRRMHVAMRRSAEAAQTNSQHSAVTVNNRSAASTKQIMSCSWADMSLQLFMVADLQLWNAVASEADALVSIQ